MDLVQYDKLNTLVTRTTYAHDICWISVSTLGLIYVLGGSFALDSNESF